jgi:hypothetical protein
LGLAVFLAASAVVVKAAVATAVAIPVGLLEPVVVRGLRCPVRCSRTAVE